MSINQLGPKQIQKPVFQGAPEVAAKAIELSPKVADTVVKVGQKMNPLWQRLIIGVTALPLMTAIDYYNPCVDKETRKTSAIRTAIKVVICTASGLLTRFVAMKLGTGLVGAGKLPIPAEYAADPQKFVKGVSDVFAVLGGIASVFVIDLPFINKILNMVMAKVKPANDQPDKQKGQVTHYA